MKKRQELPLRMLDAKFAKGKALSDLDRPAKGWIRAIREGIGMTAQQLAKRLGVSLSRVSAIEKDERLGNLKVSTLERAAEALGCRLVYTFVPHVGL